MDAFTDPYVEEIVFVKPTQVGGTECILNILGYLIDQDGSPTLVLYPSDIVGEHVSKNRIQPMLQKCSALRKKYDEKNSKLLELNFTDLFVALSGANTPSQLASKPIRFLMLDEVDKYPARAGKEADPISLARERTKTFAYNRKIFITSTPTYESGAIWQAFQKCETKYYFYVPCPHCSRLQRLHWRQVKFDKDLPLDSEKADSARYECEYCGGMITDGDKADMLAAGEWRAESSGTRARIGFHLNALYSPWVTFRDAVAEFLEAKRTPETLMNFINSWLAEPFEQVSSSADAQKILDCRSRFTRGMVPDEAQMITGGVDKQKDCYYYTVRAWGENRRSWNIDHGIVATETELIQVFDRAFYDESGRDHYVDLVLVDSGDDTDTVYDFCYINQGLFAPVKGSSTRIDARYSFSTIEKAESMAKGMQLVRCDGSYYKDMIFRRITSKKYQDWFVYDGCDEEYAKQVTAEHKVIQQKNGRDSYVWKTKSSGAGNHYLDCEVYAACAADVMGAFDLVVDENGTDQPVQAQPAEPVRQEYNGDQDDWIGGGDDWL